MPSFLASPSPTPWRGPRGPTRPTYRPGFCENCPHLPPPPAAVQVQIQDATFDAEGIKRSYQYRPRCYLAVFCGREKKMYLDSIPPGSNMGGLRSVQLTPGRVAAKVAKAVPWTVRTTRFAVFAAPSPHPPPRFAFPRPPSNRS